MKIQHNLKYLINLMSASGNLLRCCIWLVVAVIFVTSAGRLEFKHPAQKPPRVSIVPAPKTDWQGVDNAIVSSLKAAHRAAELSADSQLNAWINSLTGRVDSSFLPWYFGYWNQQLFGIQTAWYWSVNQLGINQTTAQDRIRQEIQQQFTQQVLRPKVAQMELERIAIETLHVYINDLNPRLAAIPLDFKIPQPEWERYLNDIAIMTTSGEGNRQVPVMLKTIAAASVGGSIVIAKALGPEIREFGGKAMGRIGGHAVGELAARTEGKAMAKLGGKFLGEIIGFAIIIWDVADHYRTKKVELPILRKNITDYFFEMRERLLHDPENGIITVLDGIQSAIISSLRTRSPVHP